MTQQGGTKRKNAPPVKPPPGKTMFQCGIGMLALGVFLLVASLGFSGPGYADSPPQPAPITFLLIVVGVILTAAGSIIRHRR